MIAKSTISNMTDGQGVLHENLGFQTLLGQFLADYATGKGIFMRNLSELNAAAGNQFDTFIKLNAASIWCNRVKGTCQFKFNWDSAPGYEPDILTGKSQDLCNLIMQAAAQDALNAAVRISPNGQITCNS